MKILMVNSFFYLRGGRERCFFDLMELLEAHGHEVIPFSMHHEENFPSEYSDYFVSNVDFPSLLEGKGKVSAAMTVLERVIYSREAKEKIERLIADTQPDMVHIHGFMHEMSPSILSAIRAAGLPVVQTLHDYKMLCPNTNFVSGSEVCERCKGGHFYNAMVRKCKRGSLPASVLAGTEMYIHRMFKLHEEQVDLFISPSEFLADKAREHGVQKPIYTIPNFINPDNFQPYYEPENYIVFAGRIVDVKGVPTLVKAMEHVPETHLYIAGWGEIVDELKAFVADKGMTNVSFVGHLDTAELEDLVQRASFTVVPSEWYENYSMSVIEALACGTPVLGARIGGIPEQVVDGWNGMLFESGNVDDLTDKLKAMLSDRDRLIEMGHNARSRIEQLNGPEYHYRETMNVYEKLLKQPVAVA